MEINLETVAKVMSLVNAGANDIFYHAVMDEAPMQFIGNYYKFPDGTILEATAEDSFLEHGLVNFNGVTLSASAVLDELEFSA